MKTASTERELPSRPGNGQILFNKAAGSLAARNRIREPTDRWELPTHAEPHARRSHINLRSPSNSSSIAIGKRPATGDPGNPDRSELPAEHMHQTKSSLPPSFQPPAPRFTHKPGASTSSSYRTPSQSSELPVDSAAAKRAQLRAERRRKFDMLPELEDPTPQNRRFELPASIQRRASTQQFVNDRSPLSNLERWLDPQRLSVYHGYASNEDLSQVTCSQVSTVD